MSGIRPAPPPSTQTKHSKSGYHRKRGISAKITGKTTQIRADLGPINPKMAKNTLPHHRGSRSATERRRQGDPPAAKEEFAPWVPHGGAPSHTRRTRGDRMQAAEAAVVAGHGARQIALGRREPANPRGETGGLLSLSPASLFFLFIIYFK